MKKPKTKHYHFTALVPMGGEYKGEIALHSTVQQNIEYAIIWAKNRFEKGEKVVVVLDSEYPRLYPPFEERKREEFYIERNNYVEELYNTLDKIICEAVQKK